MDGTYDINYDDGEKELRVEERLIRKLADDSISPGLQGFVQRGRQDRGPHGGREKYYPARFPEIEATGPTTLPTMMGKRDARRG